MTAFVVLALVLCIVMFLLPHSFERFPIELPETIRVNIVSGEFASYAQARGDFAVVSLSDSFQFNC